MPIRIGSFPAILGFLAASAVFTLAPASAAGGATLGNRTVLPQQPPLGGLVRLQLRVTNDSGTAWSAQDTVRLRWERADGRSAAVDVRPLGQGVGPKTSVTLTFVTLAPSEVGDFKLITQLSTSGKTLQIGEPVSFHLAGFLFRGHGNGHGLGMSQWGARGRAAEGQDYRAILAAYYRDTQLEARDTARMVRISLAHQPLDLSQPWARLFGPFPQIAGPLTVESAPLTVGTGDVLGFGSNSAGQPVVFVQAADGSRRGQPVLISQTLKVHSAGPAGIRTNLLEALDGDFRPGSEQRRYAGSLEIIPKGGARIRVVNVVPLEDYLKGVVPAEMPPFWGTEALKAQAVAARTYALRKIGRDADFDLEGNEFDQAYGGLSQQRSSSNEAVEATRGQVLTASGRLVDALYMASGGGHTENSEYGFIRWDHGLIPAATIPYLRGIADPLDHAPGWEVGPFAPSTAAVLLRDRGEDVGDALLGIDVLQSGPSGRILGARLRGTQRTVEVSGPYLRYLFGLPDTLVEIVGGA